MRFNTAALPRLGLFAAPHRSAWEPGYCGREVIAWLRLYFVPTHHTSIPCGAIPCPAGSRLVVIVILEAFQHSPPFTWAATIAAYSGCSPYLCERSQPLAKVPYKSKGRPNQTNPPNAPQKTRDGIHDNEPNHRLFRFASQPFNGVQNQLQLLQVHFASPLVKLPRRALSGSGGHVRLTGV